jgi:hypothetical protein
LFPRETVQEPVFAAPGPSFAQPKALLLSLFFLCSSHGWKPTTKPTRIIDEKTRHYCSVFLQQTFIYGTQSVQSWVFYNDNHHTSCLETDHNHPTIIARDPAIAALSSCCEALFTALFSPLF